MRDPGKIHEGPKRRHQLVPRAFVPMTGKVGRMKKASSSKGELGSHPGKQPAVSQGGSPVAGHRDAKRTLSPPKAFNLTRWFSLLSLVSVATISGISAVLLSNFLTNRMLNRDAVLTMEFVQSVVLAEGAASYFVDPKARGEGKELEEAFYHFAQMPDVLRANVYSRDHAIIWSSERSLAGKKFERNPELDEALAGELVVNSGAVRKEEHAGKELLDGAAAGSFIETYIPIRDGQTGPVVGVVEIYRTPNALFETIRTGQMLIWGSAIAGGAFLYVVLFWIVRRADTIIRQQQERLLKAETFSVIGEMASAVAHGIRNPLSSIRSSAEFALEGDAGSFREPAQEIIAEVDRLERWVRSLLSQSRPLSGILEKIEINPILRESLGNFARDMERRNIAAALDLQEPLPAVEGDVMLLGQVMNSLLANALEAIVENGKITLSSGVAAGRKHVLIGITDTGPGAEPAELEQIFKPFYTTKPKGLGLGLPLAKRIIERFGGTIAIDSRPGAGTRVHLRFPVAA
jgi:two-component system sensor histidine kinase HydH